MDNCEICNKLKHLDELEYYNNQRGKYICKDCINNYQCHLAHINLLKAKI